MIIVAIRSIDGEFIPLIHIESINSGTSYLEAEEHIVARLKDEKFIRVTTFSGHRYICSLVETIETLKQEHPNSLDLPKTADECYAQVVYPSWCKQWKKS